jgi:hypothetical protein
VAIRAQVHGDVFRPPSRLPLFAALIGTGASVLRSLALSRSFVFVVVCGCVSITFISLVLFLLTRHSARYDRFRRHFGTNELISEKIH